MIHINIIPVATVGADCYLAQALVHTASTNVDTEARMSMHMTYGVREVFTPAVVYQVKSGMTAADHWRRLRPLLRADRRHILLNSSLLPRL